jgi:hypothetical protein
MNADSSTTLMTLTSLQVITFDDSGPARTKWSFTAGALGGSTVSAIGYLIYQLFF